MKADDSNECPNHNLKNCCFCQICGKVMCIQCAVYHKRHVMKPGAIEVIDTSLLSNFKFEKCLGKGRFSSVFKVLSVLEDKVHALKVIEGVNKEDFFLFKKEISLMVKINHPNLVKYHSSCWVPEKDLLWIAMELCEDNLEKYIHKLDQKTAFEYFKQICEGVFALHQEKMIHGNLKLPIF